MTQDLKAFFHHTVSPHLFEILDQAEIEKMLMEVEWLEKGRITLNRQSQLLVRNRKRLAIAYQVNQKLLAGQSISMVQAWFDLVDTQVFSE